jgi:peptidoglycan/LPS O-acetylase OafA/YrhL
MRDPAPSIAVRREHHPCLDGLRGIAVLLVLYGHAPQLFGGGGSPTGFWSCSPGTWLGVDLFFVLSGYLITTILLHERGRPRAFVRFWVRRALRIFPLAYAYLGALALVALALPGFEHLRSTWPFVWAATYLLNFHIAATGWTAAALGILWSLAVEEHFYFVWPWLALRARLRAIVGVLIAVIVGTPLLRWVVLERLGPVAVYVATFTRWDTLAFGALLACARASSHWPAARRLLRWLVVPALGFVAMVIATPIEAVRATTPTWFHVLGYSGVALGGVAACTLALEPSAWTQRLLGNRWLGAVGRISYGLYVLHVLTAELTRAALDACGLGGGMSLRVLLWLAVLFGTAAASYRWFEAPLLRWKDRWR